jgi:hypothetical protein
MSTIVLWLGRAGTLVAAATLAGLLVRGRWRLWYTFPLLILAVMTHDLLVGWWPHRFHRSQVWQLHQYTLIVIRLAMVIELAIRVFRGFPGAMATARRALIMISAAAFLVVTALPTTRTGYAGFVGEVMPRILNGTVWLFAAVAVLIVWYRLPVHWFPKAVLLSYVPYLLVFTVAMNTLGAFGWERGAWVNHLNVWAWRLLALFWAYNAWRPDPSRSHPPAS